MCPSLLAIHIIKSEVRPSRPVLEGTYTDEVEESKACEYCQRRKIKCTAVTPDSSPCTSRRKGQLQSALSKLNNQPRVGSSKRAGFQEAIDSINKSREPSGDEDYMQPGPMLQSICQNHELSAFSPGYTSTMVVLDPSLRPTKQEQHYTPYITVASVPMHGLEQSFDNQHDFY